MTITFILRTLVCVSLVFPSLQLLAEESVILEPLSIELENIAVTSVSFDGAVIKVALLAKNPNSEEIVVETMNYSVKLNNSLVRKSTLKGPVHLPGLKTSRVSFDVSQPYDATLTSVIAALNSTEPQAYEIEGNVTVSGRTEPFYFHHKDRLTLP